MKYPSLSIALVLAAFAAPAAAQCEFPEIGSNQAFPGGWFGYDVAVKGDFLAVGHPLLTVGGKQRAGVVEIFEHGIVPGKKAYGWIPRQTLISPTTDEFQSFGTSVAFDASRMIAGAPFEEVTHGLVTVEEGTANIYRRVGTTFEFEQRISPSSPSSNARFGSDVAIAGSWLAVGAPGSSGGLGATYLFEKPLIIGQQSTWQERLKLAPTNGSSSDQFGNSVDMSADTIVVGSPGATGFLSQGAGKVTVYTYNNVVVGPDWTVLVQFSPISLPNSAGFGRDVALDGTTMVIGAPGDKPGGTEATGSAYVYSLVGSTWSHVSTLRASDGKAGDNFGASVDVQGGRILVGASRANVNGNSGSGAVYWFEKQGSAWPATETAKLTSKQPGTDSYFGGSVAIEADKLFVGEVGDDASLFLTDTGTVHAYSASATLCATPQVLSASAGGNHDMSIDVGPAFGGMIYLVVGSVAGTSPGLPVDGFNLPLNYDGPGKYYEYTLVVANSATHQATFGFLDFNGHAAPRLAMPPGLPPSVLNLTFHHAALVFDPAQLKFVTATNAFALNFEL